MVTLQTLKEMMELHVSAIACVSADTTPQRPSQGSTAGKSTMLSTGDADARLSHLQTSASVADLIDGIIQAQAAGNDGSAVRPSGEQSSVLAQQSILYINQSLGVLFRLLETQARLRCLLQLCQHVHACMSAPHGRMACRWS
jgi:hypothetical protein